MSDLNIEQVGGYSLKNIGKINILMGKNGCGKSTVLRMLDSGLSRTEFGNIKYISPERGGFLTYEPSIDKAISDNKNWIRAQRSKNQAEGFKRQTVAQYRNLETFVLRRFEIDPTQEKFDIVISEINTLLSNLEIKREGTTFTIKNKEGLEVSPENISSGESELIALAIETLVFRQEKESGKQNILLLDEPDVHLHPDLQVRLMRFLSKVIKEDPELIIILSTHSTAILGSFEGYDDVRVCFMKNKQTVLDFEDVSDVYKKILPIFGAHPLSNIFNKSPILIVEGEDDVRIWQQVVRSSEGRISIYPCEAGTKNKISEMEDDAKRIIDAIYDEACGYSLRDRDDDIGELGDKKPIICLRTRCRNAESLILSNEVLSRIGSNWEDIQNRIDNWILLEETKESADRHKHFEILKKFKDGGYNRCDFDLKEVRNDLLYFVGCNKPWEVVIGQVIAEKIANAKSLVDVDGSIYYFLGNKIVNTLLSGD